MKEKDGENDYDWRKEKPRKPISWSLLAWRLPQSVALTGNAARAEPRALGPSCSRGWSRCVHSAEPRNVRARASPTRKLSIRGTSTSIKPTDAHEGGGSGTLAIGCSESSAVPVQRADVAWGEPSPGCRCGMERAQSPCRCGRGRAQSRCSCGGGEPSPGADVAGASPVPVQMWRADHDEAALKTSSV